MSETLARTLDLPLAWRRVKSDWSDRTFLSYPFVSQLVENDIDRWIDILRTKITQDQYAPAPCKYVGVPKGNGTIRPGADLSLEDQVVFSALFQAMRPQIQDAVEWEDSSPDYSYRFRKKQDHHEFYQLYFKGWKSFDRDSLAELDERPFVVTADIAGYYELIDMTTLRSDLSGLNVNEEALALLHKCLHRWARSENRGIPQGYSPADGLGKLYLNSVDRALRDEGYVHKRWVDDFRVFCESEIEAREALSFLIDLLGNRGLVVQTAKTRIINSDAAKKQFNQPHNEIEPISERFQQFLREMGIFSDSSRTTAQIDEFLTDHCDDENLPVAVLKEAFDNHFLNSDEKFNKSLFHYLLGRLGKASDDHALDTVVSWLFRRPEETKTILKYAHACDASSRIETEYVRLVGAQEAAYPYQSFQILRWRLSIPESPSAAFLNWVREQAFGPVKLPAIGSYARAILGMWGTTADWERLQQQYSSAATDIEKTVIICSIQKMEKSRRNRFLGRIAGDSEMTSRAARIVRSGKAIRDPEA